MAEQLENASRLDGRELAEGLGLDLEEIWAVGERVSQLARRHTGHR